MRTGQAPPNKQQKKDETEEKEKAETKEGDEKQADTTSETRLFVMNLSYTVTNDELNELFGKFGEVEKIEIPLRKGGKG